MMRGVRQRKNKDPSIMKEGGSVCRCTVDDWTDNA